MRIESVNRNPNGGKNIAASGGALNFRGALNNKMLLSGLEKISEHGSSFAAGVSLAGALFLRPFAISITPDTREENKKYAGANSIGSAAAKFLTAEAVAIPIENAVKKIDSNPEEFLNSKTIKNLKATGKELTASRDYKFLTQFIKLSANLLSAIPKSVLTVALIPVIMDKIFERKEKNKESFSQIKTKDPVFDRFLPASPAFCGKNKLALGIGKIIDNGAIQDFAKKYSKNDTNIARNFSNATDILLTASAVIQTKKSPKIKEENKNPLVYNNIMSTAASILFGTALDKAAQKAGKGLIDRFVEANKNNPKLSKYIEGINILRPTIIFALIYYGLLPVATTFLSDKIDKLSQGSKSKKD